MVVVRPAPITAKAEIGKKNGETMKNHAEMAPQ